LVDATVGEGGHADLLLERDPTLELIGVDADPAMLRIAGERLAVHGPRCRLVHARFSTFFARYPEHSHRQADAVLLDLGVSMYHFLSSGRGFSFQRDEPLDMRLDPGAATTAADLVNDLPERDLADLLFRYGGERDSRRIARAVAHARTGARIRSTRELSDLVRRAGGRGGRLHPATRVFQALRIAVNDEMGEIERGLPLALGVLVPGGRIGVISFHSLEDRLVKGVFRRASAPPGAQDTTSGPSLPGLRLVVRKPVRPHHDEVRANRASRSARLRVAERDGAGPAEGEGRAEAAPPGGGS
jgi:16S rRNA (cytosine1402-N4)-methyltransferase